MGAAEIRRVCPSVGLLVVEGIQRAQSLRLGPGSDEKRQGEAAVEAVSAPHRALDTQWKLAETTGSENQSMF